MKILIVKTSALGDVLQCFCVLTLLGQKFPHAQIDWVVERSFAELLKAHPHVTTVIEVPIKALKKHPFSQEVWCGLKKAWRLLRRGVYDVVFDLQGNIKSGLITYFARGKEKVGFTFASAPEWPSSLFVSHRYVPASKDVSLRYLSLVQQHFSLKVEWVCPTIKLQVSTQEQKWVDETLKAASAPRLMICLGSHWENKKLSVSTWISFLEKVCLKYAPFFFFVWGNEKEYKEVEQLHTRFSKRSLLLPRMRLPVWQRMMEEMAGVISVDSSALHLVATTSTPSFSFFGPSSSKVYCPRGEAHGAFQGSCPYGQSFTTRCSVLRTCLTGACLKALSPEVLFQAFVEWDRHLESALSSSLVPKSCPQVVPPPTRGPFP